MHIQHTRLAFSTHIFIFGFFTFWTFGARGSSTSSTNAMPICVPERRIYLGDILSVRYNRPRWEFFADWANNNVVSGNENISSPCKAPQYYGEHCRLRAYSTRFLGKFSMKYCHPPSTEYGGWTKIKKQPVELASASALDCFWVWSLHFLLIYNI